MELSDHSLQHRPTPIEQDARTRFNGGKNNIHHRLELFVQNETLNESMQVKDYMLKHKRPRMQMIHENYQKIQDERTGVGTEITGDHTHLNLRDIERFLRVVGMPNSLRILEERLMNEEMTVAQEVKLQEPSGDSSDRFV